MIGCYDDVRVLFRIFRLRRREEDKLTDSVIRAGEKKLRASARFGREGVCEVLAAKQGGPELAYATRSSYRDQR